MVSHAQSARIKRKYLKTYQGEIPAFSALVGSQIIEIPSGKIELILSKDSVHLLIGSIDYRSTYQSKVNDRKTEIEMTFSRENSDIPERLILVMKDKKIIRKGISPQPDAVLTLTKKSRKG